MRLHRVVGAGAHLRGGLGVPSPAYGSLVRIAVSETEARRLLERAKVVVEGGQKGRKGEG